MGIELLTSDETLRLLKLAKQGDEQAKTLLIQHNSPLVKSIVRRYKNKGAENDDLYQLGLMGLLKAVNNFDESFEVRFSTYAVPLIIGEIKRFLRDDGYIKVSRSIKSLSAKITAYIDDARKNSRPEPTVKELAQIFEVDDEEIVFAMDSNKMPLSIFEKVDENENSQSLIDKIVVEDESERIAGYFDLKNAIMCLNERERKIIMLRYFRDKTQSEVAKELNVSQVQVSRLESKILTKMKEQLRE